MASSARQAIACILLILGVAAYAQAQSSAAKEQTASISGKVTFKGKGAAGIVVVVVKPHSHLSRYRATTDDEGNYRVNNIPPGTYHAFPLTPALVVEKARSKRSLVVAAGEVIRDVDFAMVRGGAITGRITNADGQPLVEEGVNVESINLQPEEYEETIPLQTDDRGIYRAFGLRPGKYRVSVGQPIGGFAGDARQTYRRTFYPSVTEVDKATLIEVNEGSEANNVDIVTPAPPVTFTVSGRVIDGETGKPIPGVTFGIQKTEGENSVSTGTMTGTNGNGEFKLQNVMPGRYTLYAVLPENNETRADPFTFDVVDADLTGLEMKTKKGASLSGMVVMEGSPEKTVTLREVHIYAWMEDPPRVASRGTRLGADGSFKLSGLPAGKVYISVAIFDPRERRKFELLRVEHNGVPQPGSINIKEGEQVAGVRLVVKYFKGTGAINGQLKIENGELPPFARITLWAAALEE